MSDWSAGYLSDVDYTFGYYAELNPLRIKLAFLNNNLVYPECGTACELGYGQGLSTNFHAAASVIQWFGTDFNPAQASFAQELTRVSSASTKLFDDSFAQFLERTDLPDFDYIGLHGIWSWISDENRRLIVKFIKRKLKVGGVVYVSYNTMPGWAAFAPMRHLLTEHAEIIGSEGRGTVGRVDDALEFSSRLLDTNPIYARANSTVSERFKALKEQNRHYLAHEYFNKDWQPMHFSEIAKWLEPAKLQFACSAHFLDQIHAINLSEQQRQFLAEIPDPMFKQSVLDFMMNRQFRRDYWVKGLRNLAKAEKSSALATLRVVLTNPRDKIELNVSGTLGKADLTPAIYNPILDTLSDHTAKSLEQVSNLIKEQGIKPAQILEAVVILVGIGHLSIAQDESIALKTKVYTDRINIYLLEKSRNSGEINFLTSPITGGGIQVTRFHQLFLLAKKKGYKKIEEWASFASNVLVECDEKIIKEGKVFESEEETLQELTQQAEDFSLYQLPILRSLRII